MPKWCSVVAVRHVLLPKKPWHHKRRGSWGRKAPHCILFPIFVCGWYGWSYFHTMLCSVRYMRPTYLMLIIPRQGIPSRFLSRSTLLQRWAFRKSFVGLELELNKWILQIHILPRPRLAVLFLQNTKNDLQWETRKTFNAAKELTTCKIQALLMNDFQACNCILQDKNGRYFRTFSRSSDIRRCRRLIIAITTECSEPKSSRFSIIQQEKLH